MTLEPRRVPATQVYVLKYPRPGRSPKTQEIIITAKSTEADIHHLADLILAQPEAWRRTLIRDLLTIRQQEVFTPCLCSSKAGS